jgi:hypothetical protein
VRPVLLYLLLLLPGLALADYKSDYRDGVAAAERQEWAKVESLMRRALAERPDPDPKDRIRMYGQRFVPYLPHFYLGLAAFSRGDCNAAVGYLEEARNAGAVRGLREADRQSMMLRSCKAKLAAAAPPANGQKGVPVAPKPAPPVVRQDPAPTASSPNPPPPVTSPKPAPPPAVAFDNARAQALNTRMERLAGGLATQTQSLSDPALSASRADWQRQTDMVSAQLRQLQVRTDSARKSQDTAALAPIEREFSDLEAGVARLTDGIQAAISRSRGVALADARTQLDQSLSKGDRLLDASADRQSAEAKSLTRALEQGRKQLGANSTSELLAASNAVELAARAFDASSARSALAGQVRGRLRPLAQAYLSGDFARAASWAGEAELRAVPEAHAEALLLRAAARLELYVVGGERDTRQFEQIREDIRAARRVSASVQPSERAYSPRFRTLFASTR